MSKIKRNCVCICGNITVDRLGKVEDIDMALSRTKSIFRYNVQEVWDVVTSLEKYQWRSDLSKIDIINEPSSVCVKDI